MKIYDTLEIYPCELQETLKTKLNEGWELHSLIKSFKTQLGGLSDKNLDTYILILEKVIKKSRTKKVK